MNLFYTINNKYVPQLGAAICSVCENNRATDEIHFYIGAQDITPENQHLLSELTKRYDRLITFIAIKDIREQLGFEFDSSGWNEIVVARLLIDRLLPVDVHRVLYLDGDTIVRGSLKELWETDMKGNAIAASIEPTANYARKKALGLETLPYFNSGVLLYDLKTYREQHVANTILEYYKMKEGKLFAPDQDAINGALPGKITILSPKYNFCNIYWYYSYNSLVRISKPAPYLSKEIFEDAVNDPRIIHYLGEDRPWRKGNTHRYSADFHKYLAMTPWKDMPMEEGWETYFKLYGAYWKVLKPFPMLQYRIMDTLIPFVIKYRAKKK